MDIFRRFAFAATAVATALAIAPLPTAGQEAGSDAGASDPWGFLGLHLGAANPVGEFGELVDLGFAFAVEARFPIALDGALSLRTDFGAIIYGSETNQVCFPPPIGCRIATDLTTTNSIVHVSFGPELSGTGPIAPYAHGGIGFSYFSTNSSLSGANDPSNQQLFQTRNFGDGVVTLRMGTGVRFEVASTSGGPVSLDVGVDYHHNGVAEYLRRGDIVDLPDGNIEIRANRTEANLLVFRVGASFGVGGGGDGR